MFNSLIGERVTVVVSSKAEILLEYTGNLSSESEDAIELTDVYISYLIADFSPFSGVPVNKTFIYKKELEKVIISKKYTISCNKLA
ncbi:MAG: hypothetical protein J6Y28_05870 [Acholeplasmatales bacterium]|nr:hypothetical protein [Acholeplasmatales bacterium]